MSIYESNNTAGLITTDVLNIASSDRFLSRLPDISTISSVVGGVAHRVYCISTETERYYLKIRGDRFIQVPSISCNPADINIEYSALQHFCEIAPDNFPRVVSFNPDKFYMVLTDAIPDGEKLEPLLIQKKVTSQMIHNLARTLKNIHDSAKAYTQGIRPDDDVLKYEELLQHRFGYRHNIVLDDLVSYLKSIGNRHLILSDASPKNIGLNNHGELFTFFDLETAHKGDAIFDFSYLLAHIVLHTFHDPVKSIESIKSYLKGYGDQNYDEKIVKTIVLGIILYRLGGIIPYPTQLSVEQEELVKNNSESALNMRLEDITWQELILLLKYE